MRTNLQSEPGDAEVTSTCVRRQVIPMFIFNNLSVCLPWLTIAAIGVLLVPATASGQTSDLSWPNIHHDPQRSGRSLGVGAITSPAVVETISIGGSVSNSRAAVLDIDGDGSLESIVNEGSGIVARRFGGTLAWDTPPLGANTIAGVFDLDGDGNQEVVVTGDDFVVLNGRTGLPLWRDRSPNGVYVGARVVPFQLDEDPQMELLLSANRAGDGEPLLAAFDFGEGFVSDAELWRVESAELPSNVGQPVVGDFTTSPGPEVAVVNRDQCRVLTFRAETGAALDAGDPTVAGRYCYGRVEVIDLDGNGRDDLFFSGSPNNLNNEVDGSTSIVAYTWNGAGAGSVLWLHDYGMDTPRRIGTPRLADVDGVGGIDVVVSVYDNGAEVAGDDGVELAGSWGTVVYRGFDGQTIGTLNNEVLVSLGDLDRDGSVEVVTRRADAGFPTPLRPDTSVWQFDDEGNPTREYQLDALSLVEEAVRDRGRSRSRGGLSVPCRSGEAFLFLDYDESTLQRVTLSNGTLEVLAETPVPPGSTATCLSDAETAPDNVIVLKTNDGSIDLRNNALNLVASNRLSGHTSRVLVVGDEPVVIATNSRGQLEATTSGGETQWSLHLRGGGSFEAAAVGDDYHIARGSVYDTRMGFIEVTRADGSLVWTRDFPDGLNAPRHQAWGRFGSGGLDLAVAYVGLDGVGKVTVLDGATGEPTGVSDLPENARNILVLPDSNGDDIDEIVLMYWRTAEVRDPQTLQPISEIPAFGARSGSFRSALLQADDDEALELFPSHRNGGTSVVDLLNADEVWSLDPIESVAAQTTLFAGITDADGDGFDDIAIPGTFSDVVRIDGATGTMRPGICLRAGATERLDEPASASNCQGGASLSDIVVADIDGNGDEDFIVGGADGWLYAIPTQSETPIWTFDLRREISHLALADWDGDGTLEILATTSGSEIVIIDESELTAPSEVRDVASEAGQVVDPEVDIDLWSESSRLGVAWEPAGGADGYLVTLFTENNNQVLPYTDVGNTESHVFTGLQLVSGTTYFASVVAYGPEGLSAATESDGVLILDADLDVVIESVMPNPFVPANGETTTVTATITNSEEIEVTVVMVTYRLLGQEVPARTDDFDPPDAGQFTTVWDGTNESGALVAAGDYEVTVTAFANDASRASDVALVTVLDPEAEDVGTDTGSDDVGSDTTSDRDAGGYSSTGTVVRSSTDDGCGCGCMVTRPRHGRLTLVLVVLATIALLLLRRR